jgi:TPP-dependent pyruvate/acetoin dehydrogenase alpha subunit
VRREKLTGDGRDGAEDLEAIDAEVEAEVEDAVAFAEREPRAPNELIEASTYA